MECRRCGNTDPDYFYKGHKGIYCRKCVAFRRILLTEEPQGQDYEISKEVPDYRFEFPLTAYQKEISAKCREFIADSDVLLHCVCGAGKTEIVVETIADYLKRGLKVCYAIARREVVKELYVRFRNIFKGMRVTAVYGGHHDVLTGDLIVCTTHQLFRYYRTFDLLILDEVDAFPLSGNDELMNIALNSAKANIIFSTATVNSFLAEVLKKRKVRELKLYLRPSLRPLIVPRLIRAPLPLLYGALFFLLKKMDRQCIIFVSAKKECYRLWFFFRFFFSCTYVYADAVDRDRNIRDFKDRKYRYIFATTVLERGITIKGINVIILDIHKGIFSEENLVQMLGRVGRSFNDPYGEAYILFKKRDTEIDRAVSFLKEANEISKMSLLR